MDEQNRERRCPRLLGVYTCGKNVATPASTPLLYVSWVHGLLVQKEPLPRNKRPRLFSNLLGIVVFTLFFRTSPYQGVPRSKKRPQKVLKKRNYHSNPIGEKPDGISNFVRGSCRQLDGISITSSNLFQWDHYSEVSRWFNPSVFLLLEFLSYLIDCCSD